MQNATSRLFNLFFYFLYSDVKSVLTAGAGNGVLTLFLRQAQIIFACGALLVYVSFPVPKFTFYKLEEIIRLFPDFHKSKVLLLSFVNIS